MWPKGRRIKIATPRDISKTTLDRKNNSEPFLGIGLFSASRLMVSSAFEAAWMFAWAFGIFDF